ncbi:hypothetical protein RAA17_21225 [Komagataeibacter rhaeticus]|nr:hypothetical protein [Komagataeibacter rhaeticus]
MRVLCDGLGRACGYVSFTGLLNCTRVRDSRALFDYCSARITGQKRVDDTHFLDDSPAQAQGRHSASMPSRRDRRANRAASGAGAGSGVSGDVGYLNA